MRIIAIDYGLKNIGLAISDGELAEPLGLLKKKSDLEFLSQLEKICSDNKAELIVIGLPQGKLTPLVEKLTQDLEKNLNIPVVFQDETLTSKEAVLKMVEAGKPQKKRRKEKHIVAACLILQSYLDQNKEKMVG